MQHLRLVNAHLEGDAFFWEGGEVGVLLCHGYTATTAEVRLLARYLHERGYTVAGPLLPGHGTSPHEMNRCRWPDWVAAVEEAYAALAARCERVVVGGESMGGLLALYLAARHPEVVGVLSYATAIKLAVPTPMMLSLLLWPFMPWVEKPRAARTVADERWQGYPVNPVRAAMELVRLQREVTALLPRITQPLLVMQGRRDGTVAPDAPDIIARGVRSEIKEVHWLERSVHCLLLDVEWEEAAALTHRFLRRLSA